MLEWSISAKFRPITVREDSPVGGPFQPAIFDSIGASKVKVCIFEPTMLCSVTENDCSLP